MVCISHAIFSKANILSNSGVIYRVKLLVKYIFHKEDHVSGVVVVLTVRYHLKYIATCNSKETCDWELGQ